MLHRLIFLSFSLTIWSTFFLQLYKNLGSLFSLTGTSSEAVEQARTILFMVSDAAPYMIGQNVAVDGGLTSNYAFLGSGLKKTQEENNSNVQ